VSEKQVRVQDADGNQHEYIITAFGTRKALRILQSIIRGCSGPVGEAIASMAKDQITGDGGIESVKRGVEEIKKQTDGDWGRAIFLATDAVKFDQLAFQLCSNCIRDKSQDLSDPNTFDQVFKQNFGELFEVIFEVLNHNGFLPTGELTSLSARVQRMASRLPITIESDDSSSEQKDSSNPESSESPSTQESPIHTST
jgi:hypothetical protein